MNRIIDRPAAPGESPQRGVTHPYNAEYALAADDEIAAGEGHRTAGSGIVAITIGGPPGREDPPAWRSDKPPGPRGGCQSVMSLERCRDVAQRQVGLGVAAGGGYWFLANRGLLRWLALVLVVAAPALIVVTFAWHHLVWVAVVAVALMVAAAATARAALATASGNAAMPTVSAPRPRRPFLIMNPRSGGGKVTKFGLREKAEALGAEVALLEGPGTVDVAALARKAVADGADLLGVAGGDGTQALVAGIAAEHGLPFLVISAGTRNHFALDLGLDREDPATCLDGLTDGEELRVDLGIIADRTFVNNASFGAYAEVVRSPAYRDDKRGTTLQLLPDLLKGHQGAHLSAQAGHTRIDAPQALLVATTPTAWATSPAWAGAPGSTPAPWAWSPSGSTAPARQPGWSAAGTARD
jgi:Diacylglycerol kinase catalytic domain